MAQVSSAASASRLLSLVLAAVCVVIATAHGGTYGYYGGQGYYGYYGERAGAYGGDVGGGAIAAAFSIPEGDWACYPEHEQIHGSDLTAIGKKCSSDWLEGYHEVDLICPAGSFVSAIEQLEAVSLYRFKGVVQITVTCSDGTEYGPLPEDLAYEVYANLEYYGDDTIRYRTKKGFTAINGTAGCQIDNLEWLEGKDAIGSLVTCPEGLVIRGLRFGVGQLLNSIRVCCA